MLSNRLISTIAMVFLFFIVAILATENIYAVPADPTIVTLVQADGTNFLAEQRGDEWSHHVETVDGYKIIFDKVTQNWMYAVTDVEGKLVSSNNVVIKNPPLCKGNDSEQYTETCPKSNFPFLRWKEEGSHGWETKDGYAIIFDVETQIWMYAILDVEGKLVPSDNNVDTNSPPAGVELHLRPIKPFVPQVTNPIFQDSMLILPSVDLPERGGAYQDIIFKLTKEGEWQLLDFLITPELQQIDNVEIIKTDSFPVQVFLKVTGNFTYNGQKMGQISSRLLMNRFDIWMYSNESHYKLDLTFTKIIPLPVYSLMKGEYEYSVNGRYTGTFDLAEDNRF